MTIDNSNTDGSDVAPVSIEVEPGFDFRAETIPEQVTAVMADVERIQELKDELTATVERVRTRQNVLSLQGVNLNFPVLDAAPAELVNSDPNFVVTEAPIPPRTDGETRQMVEPADDELSSHAETAVQPQDIRGEDQVQKDAFIAPDAAEVTNFQTSIENTFTNVVAQGFKDAERKANAFKGQ